MNPLSSILRKANAAYEFSGSKEKIFHLLFMDDLKLYSRSGKELDSVQTVHVLVIKLISPDSSCSCKDIGMELQRGNCVISVTRT